MGTPKGSLPAEVETNLEELAGEFSRKFKLYDSFTCSLSQLLRDLLQSAQVEVVLIESRTKGVESLREKLGREGKEGRYNNLGDVTDLSGVRIVCYLREDCDKISQLITSNFEIDLSNSTDKNLEMVDDRFGYLSLHYIASLKADRLGLPEFGRFSGLKAEIQIRTVLQHAWAAIDWRFRYKSNDEPPRELRRKLFRISAMLEAADEDFSSVSSRLIEIQTDYSSKIRRNDLKIPVNIESIKAYIDKSEVIDRIEKLSKSTGFGSRETEQIGLSRLFLVLNLMGIETIEELNRNLINISAMHERILSSYFTALVQTSGKSNHNFSRPALARVLLTLSEEDRSKVEDLVGAIFTSDVSKVVFMKAFELIHSA